MRHRFNSSLPLSLSCALQHCFIAWKCSSFKQHKLIKSRRQRPRSKRALLLYLKWRKEQWFFNEQNLPMFCWTTKQDNGWKYPSDWIKQFPITFKLIEFNQTKETLFVFILFHQKPLFVPNLETKSCLLNLGAILSSAVFQCVASMGSCYVGGVVQWLKFFALNYVSNLYKAKYTDMRLAVFSDS